MTFVWQLAPPSMTFVWQLAPPFTAAEQRGREIARRAGAAMKCP